MALICLTVFPLAIVIIIIIGGQVKKSTNVSTEKSKMVGGKIEESLQSIKTISSFAQEDSEIIDFKIKAGDAKASAIKSEYFTAAFIGILKLAIYGSYGFNFWMATLYLDQGKYNPSTGRPYTSSELISILFIILNCTSTAFQMIPNISAVFKAIQSGEEIFQIINRQPQIKNGKNSFAKLQNFDQIEFVNVSFKYPNAKENILEQINFEIKSNTTTAIVGASGSGKSTIIQLIERFYDPQQGSIKFGQVDLQDITLESLRESIGYVQQQRCQLR
ncbi:abc transporter [Stylonychia lemnae]|uniref:Abc transporter n=1 Tax=Stylonychia lemnae TaxID=5949 RepID=A0A078AZT9_STYLE|nr:abc transporter [Stylonychia lemnae]|eukprot:CDW87925.1 abc transporter [Stylonychia lemnae]